MSDSTRRAVRTLLAGAVAVLGSVVAVLALPGLADAVGVDGNLVARAGVIVLAVLTALTKLQNALEDRGTIPAVLKAPASDGADPVPDPAADAAAPEGGHTDPLLAALVALLLFCVLVVIVLVS